MEACAALRLGCQGHQKGVRPGLGDRRPPHRRPRDAKFRNQSGGLDPLNTRIPQDATGATALNQAEKGAAFRSGKEQGNGRARPERSPGGARASQPDLAAGFGSWKSGRPEYTTCRGRRSQATTSNSAFSDTSGSKGFRLQRLPSGVGLWAKDANWTGEWPNLPYSAPARFEQ
jgi:hypothetical protein